MPIYEYRCVDCGKIFEVFQKITEEPLNTCRFCNGKVQKLISQCSFHLKGTGWYATDYKKPVSGESDKSGSKWKEGESKEFKSGEGNKEKTV
ncbi:MAG: zinc ribbon domain-containing protein [Deltaproteobacteria bacterium]|nr:zinc ribbon domain-containing protein [Deltaproteobacteria bacterium]